jgi:hypothetical protein
MRNSLRIFRLFSDVARGVEASHMPAVIAGKEASVSLSWAVVHYQQLTTTEANSIRKAPPFRCLSFPNLHAESRYVQVDLGLWQAREEWNGD